MEMFGLEFPRVFDDATSLTLLTEPVHANHEFILYHFYVFVALRWYCVCSVAFAATIGVSMWRGWSMEMFGLEFPRFFDDATSLTLLTEPVHANHEFILYHFYVFCRIAMILCLFSCVCCYHWGIHVARMINGDVRTRVSEILRWRDISYTLDRACSRQPWVHTVSFLCLRRIVTILCLFSCVCCCVCSVAFAATIGVSMWRGWSMEMFGLEFPRVFDDATSLTLLTCSRQPWVHTVSFLCLCRIAMILCLFSCVCCYHWGINVARMINGDVRTRVSEILRWRDISYTLDRACSRQPWVHTVSFLCLCRIAMILCLFSCLCCYHWGIHVARMINGDVRTRVSEILRWRDISYTLDRACSRQPWVHTVSFLCLCCIVMILCLFSCVCCYHWGINVARMINGDVRTRVSEILRWRDISYTLDRACSRQPWVHTLSFLCLCRIAMILCLFSCLCCYDCGIHVARMINGDVRTRVSESLRWRDISYTLDRACSYQPWVQTVSFQYIFSVFVALWWYCILSIPFGACRGWLMELFRLEFPRVFDDAILYQLHSGQGLCCWIILWLVKFIWPGWRRWNPWNNCIAWPWMRPLAAPVSSTEVQAIFWMPGY